MLTHYIGNITEVEPGQILTVVGKSTDSALRLDLNLRSGRRKEDNIVLNLSVQFRENIICRNSRIDGVWGEEERTENLYDSECLNPIVSGDIFKFYILIGDQQFHIAINNEPYCTYAFRLPIKALRTIEVNKDLQFITQVDHRSVFPFPHPMVQFDDTRNVFSNDVPRPFKFGHVIVITGIPFGSSKGWFNIKFTEGASKRQALHMSIRFDTFHFIRNHMDENAVFGTEERFVNGGFPFALDQQFKLAIAMTPKDIRFAVDGNYVSSYNHRSEHGIRKLNGFKILTRHGLYMEITSVDHFQLDTNECLGFETYSHPDAEFL